MELATTRASASFFALAVLLSANSARATEWTVDPAKSWLGFTGTMAQAPFDGRFQRWRATISFDPAHPESGRARVTIDMASAVTGDKQKDAALPQSDWYDVKTFPEAIFEVQSFQAKGTPSSYDAIATLTMRGVKKDLTMPLSIEVNGDTLHAKGGVNLLRSDFGVGQGQWTSAQWVAFEVATAFDVTATRRP
jgi:polyisoprenoid-binding protein YceI